MKNISTILLWITTLLLLLFFSNNILAQTPSWLNAQNIGGNNTDLIRAMTKDDAGNIYVSGAFQSSITIDTITVTVDEYGGSYSLFVAKLNSDYEIQWMAYANGYETITPEAVQVDSDRNVYVAGEYSSDVDFGGITLTEDDLGSVYIAKLNSNGVWQWANKGYENNSAVSLSDFATDAAGNSYLNGHYIYGANFGNHDLYNTGHTTNYVAKINTSGTWEWAIQGVKVNGQAYGGNMLVGNSGEVYAHGEWKGTDMFILGEDTLTTYGDFLANIDKQTGVWDGVTILPADVSGIEMDNSGNFIFAGRIRDSITIASQTFYETDFYGDEYVTKFNGTAYEWVHRLYGPGMETLNSLAIDSDNSIYFCGSFEEKIYVNNDSVSAVGGEDIYVRKLSTTGDELWTKIAGGTANNEAYGIEYIGDEKVLVTGVINGSVDFDNISLSTNDGGVDGFLAEIGNEPVPVELTNFSSKITGNKVKLVWSTSSETNNSGFEIQRSRDKTNFSKIGFVEGSGTTAQPVSYSFKDENTESENYYYRLKQVDFDGTFEYSDVVEVNLESPERFALKQNYPNPFNPATNIEFSLPEASEVQIVIYNSLGQKVTELVDKNFNSGVHKTNFNASDFPSGVYFYNITANSLSSSNNYNKTRKMLLMK